MRRVRTLRKMDEVIADGGETKFVGVRTLVLRAVLQNIYILSISSNFRLFSQSFDLWLEPAIHFLQPTNLGLPDYIVNFA